MGVSGMDMAGARGAFGEALADAADGAGARAEPAMPRASMSGASTPASLMPDASTADAAIMGAVRDLGEAARSEDAWTRLGAATSWRDFAEAWLALAAAQLPAARRAVLFVADETSDASPAMPRLGETRGGTDGYAPLARWSGGDDGGGAATPSTGFVGETARLLEAVVERGSPAVSRSGENVSNTAGMLVAHSARRSASNRPRRIAATRAW